MQRKAGGVAGGGRAAQGGGGGQAGSARRGGVAGGGRAAQGGGGGGRAASTSYRAPHMHVLVRMYSNVRQPFAFMLDSRDKGPPMPFFSPLAC